ncbi:LTA synthase family protein [Fredinandcohnia humi]
MYFAFFLMLFLIKIFAARTIMFGQVGFTDTMLLEGGFLFLFLMMIETLVPKKIRNLIYLLSNVLLTAILAGIVLYYKALNIIPDISTLGQLGQLQTIKGSVFSLLEPSYLWFVADIVVILVLMIRKKFPIATKKRIGTKTIVISSLVALLLSAFQVTEVFGNTKNASKAVKEHGVLSYQVAKTFDQNNTEIAKVDKSKEEFLAELSELKEGNLSNEKVAFGSAKGKNVIMIQVESLQNFVIDLSVDGQEVTPVLNSLVDESYYFSNVYQQVGQGNTSDAEFIFNTAIYPREDVATSELASTRDFPSIARILGEQGYSTSTFHPGDKEFWNRDDLYPALGIETIYDKQLFENEDVIGIGPSDEVLFKKGVMELKKTQQPFYSQFITLSSHHPFELPKEKQLLELPEKLENTDVGNYLQSVAYTDQAIGKFIEELKKNGLYDNSLLVIYGDHQAPLQDEKLVSEVLNHEYHTIDKFNVPFLIHGDMTKQGQKITQVGGQLDMMPTVANLLGLSLDNEVIFGQDLLNTEKNLVGTRFYLPTGSYFSNSVFYEAGNTFDDGVAYSLDTHEEIPLTADMKKDYEAVLKLEKLSDDYIASLEGKE